MKSTLLNVDVSALFPYLCSIYVSHDSLVSNSVLSKVPTSSLQKSNIWEKGNEREKKKKNKWEEEGRKQKNNEVVGGRRVWCKIVQDVKTQCLEGLSKGLFFYSFEENLLCSLFSFFSWPGQAVVPPIIPDEISAGEGSEEGSEHGTSPFRWWRGHTACKVRLIFTSLVVIINSCSWSVSFKIQQRDHKPRGHCSSVW